MAVWTKFERSREAAVPGTSARCRQGRDIGDSAASRAAVSSPSSTTPTAAPSPTAATAPPSAREPQARSGGIRFPQAVRRLPRALPAREVLQLLGHGEELLQRVSLSPA